MEAAGQEVESRSDDGSGTVTRRGLNEPPQPNVSQLPSDAVPVEVTRAMASRLFVWL